MAKKFIWLVDTLFNKILGENEKCVLFLLKTEQNFWSTQHICFVDLNFLLFLNWMYKIEAVNTKSPAGTALHRGARASHYRGPSRCGAQAPDAQAQ